MSLEDDNKHKHCGAICTIMTKGIQKVSKIPDEVVLTSLLQAFMEELRVIDESFLKDMKEPLITGLKVCETNKSSLFAIFELVFNTNINGILQDLKSFLSNVVTLV